MKCPKCGEPCERDTVDVGVGEVPTGPWGCPACQWVEPSFFEIQLLEERGASKVTQLLCHHGREITCQECATEALTEREARADAARLRKFLEDHPFPMKIDDALKRAEQAEHERDEARAEVERLRALGRAVLQRFPHERVLLELAEAKEALNLVHPAVDGSLVAVAKAKADQIVALMNETTVLGGRLASISRYQSSGAKGWIGSCRCNSDARIGGRRDRASEAAMSDLVQKLRKMTQCVYLAADKGVAADISQAVHDAADEIERLRDCYQQEVRKVQLDLTPALQRAEDRLSSEEAEHCGQMDALVAERNEAERERDEARADAAQLRQDVEALAAADVELRRKIADLRHIANVNGDWTVKVSELVAALNTASALLVEAQAERDGAMDTITTRTWERDEARALLLDIDQWFRQDGASFPDYIQGRLDAALGGRDA